MLRPKDCRKHKIQGQAKSGKNVKRMIRRLKSCTH